MYTPTSAHNNSTRPPLVQQQSTSSSSHNQINPNKIRIPSTDHAAEEDPDNSWGLIVGSTLAFVTTYPLHMYVAEVYLLDNFTFLLIKYCVGFLYVIIVPVVTLCLEKEIRRGIGSVFGSAVLCLQDLGEIDLLEDGGNVEQLIVPQQPLAHAQQAQQAQQKPVESAKTIETQPIREVQSTPRLLETVAED